jgi:type I restriction-modification system DNA methylase subunit
MDEVRDFHPWVEDALKRAILEAGYTEQLAVKHHLQIVERKEPDFVLLLKGTNRPVFVLEVKRTKGDCDSHRFWSQTQDYVDSLSNSWAPNYYKYSGITNIERLIIFCRREGPVWGSALAGNPYVDTEFGPPAPNNADRSILEFISSMKKLLQIIMEKKKPGWADTWKLVVNSFKTNYDSIREYLKFEDKALERDVTSYELLRIVLYDYLKEFYEFCGSSNSQNFQILPVDIYPPTRFANMLLNSYRRVLNLDFDQVFKDHPNNKARLLPEKANVTTISYLNDFIKSANKNLAEAIKENSLPSYFVRLIYNEVYDREEMHKEGKINTDEELASLLAELCIEHADAQLMDVGTGTGALSCAAYDKIKQLSSSSNHVKTHNQILSQIFGIEKDPFLNQLATFHLAAKDPENVNTSTKVKLEVGDAFQNPRPGHFDVVLMNPPFLRHDNKVVPITDEMEQHMLTAIENQYRQPSFVRKASQPNLYFYFLNWVPHYLKSGGLAGIILMAKFLNNVDGEYVKEFILRDVESIILYPREFFQEFKSTTCIVVLRKGSTKEYVNFLRVKNTEMLENPQEIRAILLANRDVIKADCTLKRVPKRELDPRENWLIYFTDPQEKSRLLDDMGIFIPLREMFARKAERGRAGNSGGSDTIFLRSPNNPLSDYAEFVEVRFIFPGMRWNKTSSGRRHFILRESDVVDQEALGVPSEFVNETEIGLPIEYCEYRGLEQYYAKADEEYGKGWKRIVNDIFSSEVCPNLIIPRADREKHSVYYWYGDKKLVISTNFFHLTEFREVEGKGSRETQLKCICGYLMSSFGQIQFELKGNNQEGMRKLEGFMIDDFKCLDLRKLGIDEITRIAKAFEELDNLEKDVKGDEGVYTLRRKLDEAVGKVIFVRNPGGFHSVKELVDHFELFLEELVRMREM